MKNQDIRSLSVEELAAQIKEKEASLQKLAFNHAVTPLENPISLRELRRLIARLKTEQAARHANVVR
jgi:large subunit ribosomal protein L29